MLEACALAGDTNSTVTTGKAILILIMVIDSKPGMNSMCFSFLLRFRTRFICSGALKPRESLKRERLRKRMPSSLGCRGENVRLAELFIPVLLLRNFPLA
jgi:hypothetical protein